TQRLIASGLLIAHSRGEISFRHALVRDSIVAAVPPDLSIAIHRAAYRYHFDPASAPDPVRLPRLAWHAEKAGLSSEACQLYLKLADRAQRRHVYLEAELMYSRALALLPKADESARVAALRGRGQMRYRVSRYDDALSDFREACQIVERLGVRELEVEILLDEATALDWMEDYRQSRELVEKAERLTQ